MNKRTLMVATAVAALTAGSTVAFAQAPQGDHMNPASRNAPAEKIAPNPAPATHAAPANRIGQGAPQQPAAQPRRETTGQAPTEQPNAQPTPKSDRLNNAARPDERNNAARPNERNRATTGQAPTDNRNTANE